MIGGRGRNRTFNLSVKSRMLCQLSYASFGAGEPRVRLSCATPSGRENSSRTLKNIPQTQEERIPRPRRYRKTSVG